MSLLVTGSIGIDTIRTPQAAREDCLGGSAIYFSMAASFFGPVRFVGAIGADCPFDLAQVFAGRNVDLAGLEIRPESKTFRWHGTYHGDMNERTTDYLELNVLAEDPPPVPQAFRDSRFVFLANTAPELQRRLLDQVQAPMFVAADTMDHWIRDHRAQLDALIEGIHCLIINDQEAGLLADEDNLVKAAQKILAMGLEYVVIKKGESGSMLCSRPGERFVLPAYPATDVKDPTGAGDSFAGGFLGSLCEQDRVDFDAMKRAVAYGTVVASYTIAGFSLDALQRTTRDDIDSRLQQLRELTSF